MKNNRVCVGHAVNPFTVYNYMIIEVREIKYTKQCHSVYAHGIKTVT